MQLTAFFLLLLNLTTFLYKLAPDYVHVLNFSIQITFVTDTEELFDPILLHSALG